MNVYLDNSATTRPFESVVEAMNKSMLEGFYNPSALYAPAMYAERALTEARRTIAASLKANEKNVVLPEGITKIENIALDAAFFQPRGIKKLVYYIKNGLFFLSLYNKFYRI